METDFSYLTPCSTYAPPPMTVHPSMTSSATVNATQLSERYCQPFKDVGKTAGMDGMDPVCNSIIPFPKYKSKCFQEYFSGEIKIHSAGAKVGLKPAWKRTLISSYNPEKIPVQILSQPSISLDAAACTTFHNNPLCSCYFTLNHKPSWCIGGKVTGFVVWESWMFSQSDDF